MLFQDYSCISKNTIERHASSGIHKMLGSDWFGIMGLSKRGNVIIDACYDASGIGDNYALEFVHAYAEELQIQDYDYKEFIHNGAHFVVFPVRENEFGYLIFFVHCRLAAPFEQKDLKWYVLYAHTAYSRLLLNNELIMERNYLSEVMESTESFIIVFDGKHNVVSYNKIAGDFLSPDSTVKTFTSLSAQGRQTLGKMIDEIIASGSKQYLNNVAFESNHEKRILNMTLSPLRNSKGAISGVVMVGADITKKQLMEYEFEQLKHYSLLGEISLGLSHDVKNPLMNISCCAGLLKKETQLNDKCISLLGDIVEEVSRIDEIISQMLSFGNVARQNTYTLVNVNEILENCIRIVNRQKACRYIEVNYHPGKSIPMMQAKNSDLQQIFLNVLLNSVQAIEEDGRIDISSFYDVQTNRIHVNISDDGIGISDADQGSLFTPYYSTKPTGTGLGLFLVKQVIEQYKGSIRLESIQGVGTTCMISLSAS